MRGQTLFVVTLASLVSIAAPRPNRPAKPPPPAPRPNKPAPQKTAPEAPAASKHEASSTAELVERMRTLYAALEYDAVIPLAETALTRQDMALADRLEVYQLLGSAKAIVVDPLEAESPFRLLLRARSDFNLPSDTPPKILAVFRKVQSEELALAAQLREVERERIVSGLKLMGELPGKARGGHALPLSFRLRDATGAVEQVRVPYRREGGAVFSTLALERSSEGDWRGQVPAEFTSDEKGFRMEYYVESADRGGPLLVLGTERAPLTLEITPGTIATSRPPPVPRWVFFTSAGLAVASGATAGGLGLALNGAQSALQKQLSSGEVIDGASYARQRAQGEQLATATNGALIALGVTAAATAVLAALTNFDPEP